MEKVLPFTVNFDGRPVVTEPGVVAKEYKARIRAAAINTTNSTGTRFLGAVGMARPAMISLLRPWERRLS